MSENQTTIPSKISADPRHPWHDERCANAEVTLNGQPVHGVVTANADDGWIEQYDWAARSAGQVPPIRRRNGVVTLRYVERSMCA